MALSFISNKTITILLSVFIIIVNFSVNKFQYTMYYDENIIYIICIYINIWLSCVFELISRNLCIRCIIIDVSPYYNYSMQIVLEQKHILRDVLTLADIQKKIFSIFSNFFLSNNQKKRKINLEFFKFFKNHLI